MHLARVFRHPGHLSRTDAYEDFMVSLSNHEVRDHRIDYQ